VMPRAVDRADGVDRAARPHEDDGFIADVAEQRHAFFHVALGDACLQIGT